MLFEYLESAEATHIGHKRKQNEDALVRLPAQGVFCLADGMGGTDAGGEASRAVVDYVERAIREELQPGVPVRGKRKCRVLTRTINAASRTIYEQSQERGRGLSGSTVSLLVFDPVEPAAATTLHAGDSPILRLRAGNLEPLVREHSFAAEAGYANERELPQQFRGVVTRAVGVKASVALEATPIDVCEGDLFLMCSDGLTKMVPLPALAAILREHKGDHLQKQADRLIEAALNAGGLDNISVILVQVSRMVAVTAVDGADEGDTDSGSSTNDAAGSNRRETSTDHPHPSTTDSTHVPRLIPAPVEKPSRGKRVVGAGVALAVAVLILIATIQHRDSPRIAEIRAELAESQGEWPSVDRLARWHQQLSELAAREPKRADVAELLAKVDAEARLLPTQLQSRFDDATLKGDVPRMQDVENAWNGQSGFAAAMGLTDQDFAERSALFSRRREALESFLAAAAAVERKQDIQASISSLLAAYQQMLTTAPAGTGQPAWIAPHSGTLSRLVDVWIGSLCEGLTRCLNEGNYAKVDGFLRTMQQVSTEPGATNQAAVALRAGTHQALQIIATHITNALTVARPPAVSGEDAVRQPTWREFEPLLALWGDPPPEELAPAFSMVQERRLQGEVADQAGVILLKQFAALPVEQSCATWIRLLADFTNLHASAALNVITARKIVDLLSVRYAQATNSAMRHIAAYQLDRAAEEVDLATRLSPYAHDGGTSLVKIAAERAAATDRLSLAVESYRAAARALRRSDVPEWSDALATAAQHADLRAKNAACSSAWTYLQQTIDDCIRALANSLLAHGDAARARTFTAAACTHGILEEPTAAQYRQRLRDAEEAAAIVSLGDLNRADAPVDQLAQRWIAALHDLTNKPPDADASIVHAGLRLALTNIIAQCSQRLLDGDGAWTPLVTIQDALGGGLGVTALGEQTNAELRAILDDHRGQLAFRQTLRSGTWGGWYPAGAGRSASPWTQQWQQEVADQWHQRWVEAHGDIVSENRKRRLGEQCEDLNAVANALGLESFAAKRPTDFGTEQDLWANAYCAFVHTGQEELLGHARERCRTADALSNAFGESPTQSVERLSLFLDAKDGATARLLRKLGEHLVQGNRTTSELRSMVDDTKQRPLSRQELRNLADKVHESNIMTEAILKESQEVMRSVSAYVPLWREKLGPREEFDLLERAIPGITDEDALVVTVQTGNLLQSLVATVTGIVESDEAAAPSGGRGQLVP